MRDQRLIHHITKIPHPAFAPPPLISGRLEAKILPSGTIQSLHCAWVMRGGLEAWCCGLPRGRRWGKQEAPLGDPSELFHWFILVGLRGYSPDSSSHVVLRRNLVLTPGCGNGRCAP